MDRVINFEIPADNIERAKKFYKETFDWQFEDMSDSNYIIIKTVKTDKKMPLREVGAINGLMFRRDETARMINYPTFSVEVENIDESIKKIKNAGGLIIKEKSSVGETGFIAYFKDTEGNILSVWQNNKKSEQ